MVDQINNSEDGHQRALLLAAFLAPWVDPKNAANLKRKYEELYGKTDQ